MKRTGIFLALALLILTGPSSWAAFRVGLGSAVAKRSAELINKAGTNDPANAVGDSAAATLASCPAGAVYDSAPTDLTMIGGIDPLGHVAPSGHTFPSDHIYPYTSTTTAYTPPLYAPGAIHITDVAFTQYLSANPVFTDYAIYFYGCRELKTYYGHVRTLSPALQASLATSNRSCQTYSTGGSTYYRCDLNVNIPMASGELIGYAATSGSFDFGSYDYRITPLAFANPSRHYGDQPYTVCPIDYFTPGPKTAMEALLGRFDGGYQRTTAPICGQINFDIVGKAKGDWFHIGSPDSPEDPHLALIDNNVYAPQQTISYGTSLPNAGPNWYIFTPVSGSGIHVDRNFSEVSDDSTIYCYDTFFDPLDQPVSGGPTFLIQMLNSTTLRFERQAAATCGAGPWAFTSNAVDFQR